jgi:hypothetical protein
MLFESFKKPVYHVKGIFHLLDYKDSSSSLTYFFPKALIFEKLLSLIFIYTIVGNVFQIN